MNLRSLLETEFLPFVIRPARYVGNELGSIARDHHQAVRVVAAVCDLYDVGMTYPALNRTYQLINSRTDAVCERSFAPDLDAEQLLRDKQLKLFSLESLAPLDEFDLLLALLPGELCAANLLTILDLSGIGLKSNEREQKHVIVGALVPPCFNPEPIAEFVDFVIAGESGDAISQVIDILQQKDNQSRSDLLNKISHLEGLYVPSFCQLEGESNKFSGVAANEVSLPIRLCAPVSVRSSQVRFSPPLVPFEEIAHESLPFELIPGAGHKCRVCPALDARSGSESSPESVADQITEWVLATGFDEITLQANWSDDYRHFDRLLELLSNRLRERQVRINLPLLRPSMRLFEAVRKLAAVCGKQPLPFLIQAGSERLREVMGRHFSIEEFYQVAANAAANGWQALRLYFMLGLPTEKQEDVAAIVEVVENCADIVQQYGDKVAIQVVLSPFIPRSHTRWQWEPQISTEEYLAKIEFLRRRLKGRNIQISNRENEPALVEGAIARGDRRVGAAIQRAYELGGRLDGSSLFDFNRWQTAFSEVGLSMSDFVRRRDFEERLPWDHLAKGIAKEQLARDCREARNIEAPLTVGSGSFKLGEIMVLKPELTEQLLAPVSTPTAGFGRKPKRKVEAVGMVVPRSRIRLLWSKGEQVRFVGHLATMRVFERAVRRSGLPVSYSQGHHPRQKLAFGPPLTLGYTSLTEYLDIQLETPFQQEMIARLNRALPQGYQISQGRPILGKASSLSSLINTACYEVALPDGGLITPEAVEELLGREAIVIQRLKGDETKEADVRKSVTNLELRWTDGINILYMELTMGNLGFVKPEEILVQGFGLSENSVLPLRVCRTKLLVISDGRRLTPFEVD